MQKKVLRILSYVLSFTAIKFQPSLHISRIPKPYLHNLLCILSILAPDNPSLIIKNILLNNPCIFPIQGKWRYPATFLLNGPKNPNIYRNAGCSSVGKEGNAVCHLYAYAHDGLQLFQQYIIRKFCDGLQIQLSTIDLVYGVQNILHPIAKTAGRQLFRCSFPHFFRRRKCP